MTRVEILRGIEDDQRRERLKLREAQREKQFPVTERAVNSERQRRTNHPWNRGYPNNRRLLEIETEIANQETE